ncbi:MAG: hypothetical protein V3R76_10785 [Gammaproteobacteria bacterium]
MRYISSYPGAYTFRLIMIVIIMSTLIVLFFNYTDRISIATEKASIQQTKNIINSSLAVVFATYAVKGELERLNELDGGNPFVHMAEYNMVPANYQGVIRARNLDDLAPGWYYDESSEKVIYKTYYDDQVYYFSQVLDYRDVNESGRYEPDIDVYRMLNFRLFP